MNHLKSTDATTHAKRYEIYRSSWALSYHVAEAGEFINLPWWRQPLGFAHTIPTVPCHACPHLMNMLLDKIGVLWDLGLKFWALEHN
jgi:hypothetical protein